jgi:hypothetical protein
MSNNVTLGSTVRSEWIKFRSVRSTLSGVLIMFVLTIGLGALLSFAVRSQWHHFHPAQRLTFDPASTSLSGVVFSQFAVGVIGALLITSEYASGSIRTTLSAVPNRYRLITAKLVVIVASMFIVTEIACFIAFFVGQSIFSGVVPTASLSNGSALRAVIFAGLYLTVLSVLSFSLGLILRHTATVIAVFASLVLILRLVTFALPSAWQNAIARFEPSELGNAMSSVIPPAHDFSPTNSLAILVLYTVVLAGIGAVLLQRRDA